MHSRPRLRSSLLVAALRRRVESAGGFATVLHHGDDDAGAILVQCCHFSERRGDRTGERGSLYEFGSDGKWLAIQRNENDWSDYIARRLAVDSDMWLVELDIASTEDILRSLEF